MCPGLTDPFRRLIAKSNTGVVTGCNAQSHQTTTVTTMISSITTETHFGNVRFPLSWELNDKSKCSNVLNSRVWDRLSLAVVAPHTSLTPRCTLDIQAPITCRWLIIRRADIDSNRISIVVDSSGNCEKRISVDSTQG